MPALMEHPTRTSERVDFRNAAKALRENAGISPAKDVASIRAIADIGAAARRLRASNKSAPVSTDVTGVNRDDPVSFVVPEFEVVYVYVVNCSDA